MRAGAAEHGDHLLAGILHPCRAVERVEAHAVVRVVHDDGHPLVTAFVDLHPPVRPRLAQTRADKFLRHAERHGDRHRGERIGDIEQTRHRDGKFTVVLRRAHGEIQSVGALFDPFAKDRVACVAAEGDELTAARPRVGDGLRGVVGVGVDAADAAAVEELQLRGVVIREIRVLDGTDVVGADVQERAHVKGHTAHAPDLERLRGDLHHQILHTVIGRLAHHAEGVHRFGGGQIGCVLKMLIELQHLGRRDVRLLGDDAVIIVDGGENGAWRLALAREPVIEDGADVVGGRALALGARDADARELVGHMIVEELAEYNHRIADVAHKQLRRVHGVGLFGDIGDRALRDCRREVLRFEVRALAEKQRGAVQAARVVAQTVDDGILRSERQRGCGQKPGARERVGIFL